MRKITSGSAHSPDNYFARRCPEFGRMSSSVNGHVAGLLSFQFEFPLKTRNRPLTLAIAICRTLKWTDKWAGSIRPY